jgi:hypothetical protein
VTATYRPTARIERRHLAYAIAFAVTTPAEPTDDNLARILAGCARRPRTDEYDAIRRYVIAYRTDPDAPWSTK